MAGSGVVFAESGVSPCPGLRLNDQGSTSGQVSLITGYGCTFAQGERPRQETKTKCLGSMKVMMWFLP